MNEEGRVEGWVENPSKVDPEDESFNPSGQQSDYL